MNKSTLLLLSLLAVLGAIVYFVLPGDKEEIVSYDRTPVTFSVDSASVVKLSIERPPRSLVIENVGGTWMITSHGNLAADPARVTEVIGGLSRFKSGSLVSSNPAKQQVFQVDSSGSLVTLSERSGASRSIIIGKMGPSFSEVYFRMPGESNVYLGSGITTWSLERDVKEWRNRTIFAAPAEAVTGLAISAGGKSREFRRDSTGWMTGRETAATEMINPLLAALSDVKAEDFIDTDVQLSGVPSTVVVSGSIAGTMDFYRLANDTARYAVTISSSAQKYIVGRYAALQFFKLLGDPRSTGIATLPKGSAAAGAPAGAGTASKQPERPDNNIEPAVTPPPAKQAGQAGIDAAAPATPKEKPKETVKATEPPPASQPSSGGAVNPFKQKSAGSQSTQAPAAGQGSKTTPPSQVQPTVPPTVPQKSNQQAPVKSAEPPPAKPPAAAPAKNPTGSRDDEGELTVHVVKKGESMTTIAKQYAVSVEEILKWNLLKSISVKPGQELYIFVRK